MCSSSKNSKKLRTGRNCPPIFVPCCTKVPVNYQWIACLPLGVNKATQTASIVLCLQRPQNRSAHQAQSEEQFSTTIMDQFDHNPGLQGTPHELTTHSTENSPSVGFLSLDVPAGNMHQGIWGMGVVPTPSIEPMKGSYVRRDAVLG